MTVGQGCHPHLVRREEEKSFSPSSQGTPKRKDQLMGQECRFLSVALRAVGKIQLQHLQQGEEQGLSLEDTVQEALDRMEFGSQTGQLRFHWGKWRHAMERNISASTQTTCNRQWFRRKLLLGRS